MEWMLLPYRRYFDFSGRSRRKEYWMFTLLQVIIGVILTALIFMDGGFRLDAFGQPDFSGGFGPLFWIGAGLGTIWALGTIIPSIAVTVRRLHDRNLTGWIYLGIVVLQFVPVVDILASIGLLVLMVLPGTVGANKYGLDPKGPAQAEVFN